MPLTNFGIYNTDVYMQLRHDLWSREKNTQRWISLPVLLSSVSHLQGALFSPPKGI